MNALLKAYIKELVESELARVPNQLVSANVQGEEDTDDVNEFSSVGGGAIMGYSLPLGMNPDLAGRKKNKPKKKRTK